MLTLPYRERGPAQARAQEYTRCLNEARMLIRINGGEPSLLPHIVHSLSLVFPSLCVERCGVALFYGQA